MVGAQPDQVLHLLTALPPGGPQRKSHLAATNMLRTAGTANLIRAATVAGARRLVAESFAGVYGVPRAGTMMAEEDPLPPIPTGWLADSIAALRSLESQLQGARSSAFTTVALRIGFLYGSDVPATRDLVRHARTGRLFLPRDLPGVASFVHADDAARAIVAAVEHPGPSEVYNVADDEPTRLVAFIDKLTKATGAPPPRHVPSWLVRIAAPVMAEFGSASLMLANGRLKRELGWAPRYPTVDAGLVEVRHATAEAA
jgi:nucleoside-diphosphate-sugar epimerase